MKIIAHRNSSGLSLLLALSSITGCGGIQSSLSTAGAEAERIANLFWVMTGAGAAIWVGVMALAVYSAQSQGGEVRKPFARRLIVLGGVIPAIVLFALLVFGLGMLPSLTAHAPEGAMKITVFGEQWWWRVRYEAPGTEAFELANEIWLPEGEPVEFILRSNNVIHSFWVPSLAGKMDLIPGRTNHLTIHPTRSGVYRGSCAEYCGRAHAQMNFYVVVKPKAEFENWLKAQAGPANLTEAVEQ
jgi:cytochrome c oxidase subunit 2